MWVMDVRMPLQPGVTVVVGSGADAALQSATQNPTPYVAPRRTPRRATGPVLHFIASDVDLIHSVTGESIWPGQLPDSRPMSAFASQIAADRRAGLLRANEDVGVTYLFRTGAVIEANGGANPFSGIALEKALLFLTKRQAGRIDLVC